MTCAPAWGSTRPAPSSEWSAGSTPRRGSTWSPTRPARCSTREPLAVLGRGDHSLVEGIRAHAAQHQGPDRPPRALRPDEARRILPGRTCSSCLALRALRPGASSSRCATAACRGGGRRAAWWTRWSTPTSTRTRARGSCSPLPMRVPSRARAARVTAWQDGERWAGIVQRGMEADLSWGRPRGALRGGVPTHPPAEASGWSATPGRGSRPAPFRPCASAP